MIYRRMFSYERQFAGEVQKFLDATGMSPTGFGKASPVGDPQFVHTMRKGRSPTARTMDKIREWMVKERPDVIRRSLCDQ